MVDYPVAKSAFADDARLWVTQDELPQWLWPVRCRAQLAPEEGEVVIAVLGEGHDGRVVRLVSACLLVCELQVLE
jgi:hypothetical protein